MTKRLAYATRGGMGEYKNPHAVALGRKGGRAANGKGARALAAKRTPQERSDAARVAINARWAKVRERDAEANADYARELAAERAQDGPRLMCAACGEVEVGTVEPLCEACGAAGF
mgnify:CR=1 FL=1